MNDSRMFGEQLRTRAVDPLSLLDHDPANPCPPLTAADFAALRQSIEEHGYLDAWPIVVSAGPACEGEIIDGFHRTKLCAEMGIDAPVVAVPCADEAEFLILQVRANLARRQLSDIDRYRLGVKLEQAYAGRVGRPGNAGQLTGVSKGDTRDLVAAEVGLSGKTYERIAKVMESEDETLKAGLESQTLSPYGAYKQLRSKEAQAALDAEVKTAAEAIMELGEAIAAAPDFVCTCGAVDSFDCTCELPLTSAADLAETEDAARVRLASEVIVRMTELDKLIQRNAITDQDFLEVRSRPHTFTGTARRLADWADLVAATLELNRR